MKSVQPSLVRRLTFAFAAGQALAMLVFFLVLLYPLVLIEEDDPIGPDLVHLALATDLMETPEHKLTVKPDGRLASLINQHPGLWFEASIGRQTLRFGHVPIGLLDQIRRLPSRLMTAHFRSAGPQGTRGDVLVETINSPAGTAIVAAGGVDSSEVSYGSYLAYTYANHYYWVPLFTGALTFLGGLIAIPVLLRSIGPTARAAAALDPTDQFQRLPEQNVVKQLLPLVRAFNQALDRVAEAFERRKRFIANVAHELRTPLAVLNMHVDQLPDQPIKPDLQRTVFRLSHMVGQMLDAERLTLAGRPHELIDLVDIARSAVADIAPLAIASGYEVALVSTNATEHVNGDPHAINRAVANLLGNAIAHGGGSGSIEVRVGPACIDVVDEGPGVSADARERIFEPFRRERWDRDGCGLGLHLVREVMRAHRGEACIADSASGAVFRLKFPTTETGMVRP